MRSVSVIIPIDVMVLERPSVIYIGYRERLEKRRKISCIAGKVKNVHEYCLHIRYRMSHTLEVLDFDLTEHSI
jgi:hypothetical protein